MTLHLLQGRQHGAYCLRCVSNNAIKENCSDVNNTVDWAMRHGRLSFCAEAF